MSEQHQLDALNHPVEPYQLDPVNNPAPPRPAPGTRVVWTSGGYQVLDDDQADETPAATSEETK